MGSSTTTMGAKAALSDKALWHQLTSVDFDDPGSSFSFTDRLARENGWSRRHAKRALEEYRRFAYLCRVSDEELTPSDEVDQVWHLHLTYTQHYWVVFKNALGAPLHHGPTPGGKAADANYRSQYEHTLRLYQKEFGQTPPSEFWPSPKVRFRKPKTARRIYLEDSWVIPKPGMRVWLGVAVVAALATALVPSWSIAADSPSSRSNQLPALDQFAEQHPIALAAIIVAVLVVIRWIWIKLPKGGKGGEAGTGCGAGGTSDTGCSGCSGCGGCGG